MDPRAVIVRRRLEGIRRIIAVASGKGGVGKSTVAVGLALVLAERGRRVGLLDLDLMGPSTHLILGAGKKAPHEDHGLVPPEVHGLRFMSIVHWAGSDPTPLRGGDVTNALLELLAVTLWGDLDDLVVDMPPGLGDTMLDAVRLLEGATYLVVTTPSRVAFATVRKLISLLLELRQPIVGLVENMKREGDPPIARALDGLAIPYLGALPFDEHMESSLGDPRALLETAFARSLAAAVP